jgi:hypothetical protein
VPGEILEWNKIEELSWLRFPLQVDDKIWITQKAEEIGEEACVTEGTQVCMQIGTITAVDELQISILLLSGETVNVTHENEWGKVN